jgi:hypothetical protein
MATVSFTPSFSHTPWVDNRDRVQASGPNGFNVRFAALQSDLGNLSTVVQQIDTALDVLEAGPGTTTRVVTQAPVLSPVTGVGSWAHDAAGNAFRPGALTTLSGIAAVVLPQGVTLSGLRAIGTNSGGGALRIDLMRAALAGGTPADRIARVVGDSAPFDTQVAATAGFAVVDNLTFRYFILALLSGAGAADSVSLSGFQISYLA